MKKLLLLLLLVPVVSKGQELTVTPDGIRDISNTEKTYVVINTPEKTAEQNYNNAKAYINKTYKNPMEVIKGEVKSEYMRFETYVTDFLIIKNSGAKVDINLKYTIELNFKEGKVKYEITSLEMKASNNNFKVLFNGSAFSGYPIYNKKKKKLIRPETKKEIEIYFNNSINEIKSYLLEEIKADDDW